MFGDGARGQDRFGGGLLKTRVGDGWHFCNEIDSEVHDFTSQQFEQPLTYRAPTSDSG